MKSSFGIVTKFVGSVLKVAAGMFFLFAGNAMAASWTWIPVETSVVDWNHDGKKDQIILEAIKEIIETKDPGDFHRVRIKIAGRPEFVLENSEGWVRLNEETNSFWITTCLFSVINKFVKSQASSINRYRSILPSDYYALTPVSPAKNNECIMLLFGYQYASSPGKLTVISLDQKDTPKTVFDKEFDLSRFEDLDNDNMSELIGQPWYGEVFGPDGIFHSYVPTYVYSLIKKKGHIRLQMNTGLSKKYNEEHNYWWVSPEVSHEYVVVKPQDGSPPRFMKLEDAEKTYNRRGEKK